MDHSGERGGGVGLRREQQQLGLQTDADADVSHQLSVNEY